MAVLESQTGAAGGSYASRVNDTHVDIGKIAGRGDVASPRPIGDSGVLWSPVFEGALGRATFENHFKEGALVGNRSTIETWSAFAGGGVRLTVLNILSLAPTVGLIYSHAENSFDARNDVGRQVLGVADKKFVNWDADLLTVVPGLGVRLMPVFGPVTVTAKSVIKYFRTEPISRSTSALSFESESEWWFNELDVEWKMPLHVWERQLRLGGYVNRSDLFGGLRDSFGEQTIYQAGGRLVVDVQGLFWKLETVGFGGGYFWGDTFSGYSYGIDLSLKF